MSRSLNQAMINLSLLTGTFRRAALYLGNEHSCINSQPLIKSPVWIGNQGYKRITCGLLERLYPHASIKSQFSAPHWPDFNFSLSFIGVWFAKIKLKPLILFSPRVPPNKLTEKVNVFLLWISPKWMTVLVFDDTILCFIRIFPSESNSELKSCRYLKSSRNHWGNHFHSY